MKRSLVAAVIALTLGLSAPSALLVASPAQAQEEGYRPLAKPGERIPLDANHFFTYGFAKAPKMGTSIMKVEIFTRDGKRDTSFTVKGDADMPSMRGAHGSGPQPFSVSAKGAYLLPINLAMPGDWEVRFVFAKNGKTVLRGSYLFDL